MNAYIYFIIILVHLLAHKFISINTIYYIYLFYFGSFSPPLEDLGYFRAWRLKRSATDCSVPSHDNASIIKKSTQSPFLKYLQYINKMWYCTIFESRILPHCSSFDTVCNTTSHKPAIIKIHLEVSDKHTFICSMDKCLLEAMIMISSFFCTYSLSFRSCFVMKFLFIACFLVCFSLTFPNCFTFFNWRGTRAQ